MQWTSRPFQTSKALTGKTFLKLEKMQLMVSQIKNQVKVLND